MINHLLVYFSIDLGNLRRFLLLLFWPIPSRWAQIWALAIGITGLSWGQCFQPAPNMLNAGFNNPRSVAVGNFNGDNQLDMVVANAGSNTISLLLGNGQGGFSTANTFPVGNFPNSIIVKDFNNDNKSDLAVNNGNSSNISILLGNGQGGFGSAINYGTGSAANSMAVGDFNGDSRPDLVAVSRNTVSVLLGNGQGGFGAATSFNAGEAATDIAVGDFNSDGWLDLVVPNDISTDEPVGYISVLIGNGQGGFGEPTRYSATGRNASYVAVGDFNNDGRSDLAVTNRGYGQKGVTVFVDNGQSGFGFTPTRFIYVENPGPITLGDFNNDNKLDLAVTYYDSFNSSGPYLVSVSLGDGQGGLAGSVNFPVESRAEDVTVGDFNGDNRLDVVTAGSTNTSSVSILLNCTGTSTSQPGLTGLSLINADNGEVISLLVNEQVVNLSTLPTQKLSIRAEASQSTASVVFALSGPQSHTQIESFLPYALFGDTESGKYNGWTPPVGQYSLQVTPYDQAAGTGSAGQPLSINFTVIKPPTVTDLSLINADNNQVVFTLTNNRQLDLNTLPHNLSIRAEASQSTASVVFALSGPQSHTQIESFLPYALFGDTESGKYNGWTPPVGQYSLQVTPYDQAAGTGSAGQPLSINFTVIKPPTVTDLSLINADNNQVIGPLTNGQVINLYSLSTRNLSIRANTQPSPTGSVVFNLSGPQNHTQTESVLPYALFGSNNSGSDNGWTPPVGQYSLRVIPYTQARAEGTIGTALYINFTVVDQATARVGAWGIDEQHLVVEMPGNPVSTEQAEVVVRGAAGKPLQLVLMDEQGRQLHQQRVEKAGVVEYQRVPLGRRTGLYLLRVTTPTESKTVRVLQVK